MFDFSEKGERVSELRDEMEDDRERCFPGETDEKMEKSGRRKDREERE